MSSDLAAGPRAARTAPVRPAPTTGGPREWVRMPAFWVTLGLLGAGGWRIGGTMSRAFTGYPLATWTAIALFALYAVPFLIFVRSLDSLEHEPPALLAIAFGWGGLVSVAAAIPANNAVQNLLAKTVSPRFATDWGPAIAGATVEEILKVLGVVAVALIAHEVNSLLDGFVYGAMVGLGFQVVENVVYAVNATAASGGGDQVGPVVLTFFVRGFLAGLWSHTMFTALAGAGVAYVVVRRSVRTPVRLLIGGCCLAGAWLCHFVWNSPVLRDGLGYDAPGVLAVLLIKGLPALVVILALVRVAEDREGTYYARFLTDLADPVLATPAEIDALRSSRTRAAARRYAYQRAGTRAARSVRRLQHAQARLAVAISRSVTGPDGAPPVELPPHAHRWCREIRQHRRRLCVIGLDEAVAPPARRARLSTEWAGWLTIAVLVLLIAAGISMAIRALGGTV